MATLITSRSNPAVQLAASLKDKKFRDRHGLFSVEGEKMFDECVANRLPIAYVFVAESAKERFLSRVDAALADFAGDSPMVLVLADHVFEKISTEKSPQGIVTVVKHLDFFKKCTKIIREEISSMGRAVILCSMQDPGNLGAVIRSAAAFGANTLILSEDCADLYHSRTLRSAMGNAFRLQAYTVSDVVGTVECLREAGRRVFAAELRDGAASVLDVPFLESDVLVIGNEGHGIPKEVSAACNGSVYIPICDGVESLNAAVAAAILMWELRR